MTVRWGIMGTGVMAAAMHNAILAEGGRVLGVASADADRAAAFAAEREIPRSHGDHHDLVEADDLDVVYVATTNDRHRRDALACVRAGVPVLVEKPFALDHSQASEVVEAARAAGVFVMEGMWMRFQPAFREIERRVAAGEVGSPRLVTADFGIAADPHPARRWFSREQGGGALLDVGIYPLTFAVSVLGEPTEVRALGELTDTGVDGQLAVAMRHPLGLSAWSCSFLAESGVEATVAGPDASLRLQSPFHHSSRLTLRRRAEVLYDHEVVGADLGYRHQIREVHRCLDEGRTESERMPLDLTLTIVRWMDEIRAQVGVTYPVFGTG